MFARSLCAAVVGLAGVGGCSFVLNFDDSQIPKDMAIDGPFSQNECDYKEPNNSVAEAAVFIPGTDVGPGAICSDADAGVEDRDYYRFTIPPATASVQVKITFPNLGNDDDLDLRLFDVTGATLYSQSRGILQEETINCPSSSPPCPMLAEGDYVFEVFPAPGSTNRYDIAVTITPM